MEKNLEKLFSRVLYHWLSCNQIACDDSADSELSAAAGLAAHVLERCLSESGFDTDMKDYVSEFVQKG